MNTSRRTLLASMGALAAAPHLSLHAQAWPARPITVIEPFAAGGAVDGAVRAIAEKARAAGIERVAFDRSGYRYHGRIKALAEAAREGGLQF